MIERPILFSAPMVRALLAGTKTQTRRVVKPQPCAAVTSVYLPFRDEPNNWHGYGDDLIRWLGRCPYGQPGDLLWGRESWRVCGGREYEYQQDRCRVMYRATHEEDGFPLGWESYKWRPSIHMPRWASRITLEVTGVRVERLQDISEADAIAEGIERAVIGDDWRRYSDAASELAGLPPCVTPRASYQSLWESINGPGSWDANPWVWVVEFAPLTTSEHAASHLSAAAK